MQLMDAFRTGQIRPNTPIAWTYAEDDGFGFTNGQVNLINKHPAFEKNELKNVIAETGFAAPSPYTDRWFELTYPEEEAEEIKEVYGCPNATDGSRVDCYDQGFEKDNIVCVRVNKKNDYSLNPFSDTFARYVTSIVWACNTRWAIQSEIFKEATRNGTLGPIYPYEFRYRNCDKARFSTKMSKYKNPQ